MSQYRIGTVNVTNSDTTVIGVGTEWLVNVDVGDGFIVKDGGVIYDVASVISDTELTLSSPYQDVTESGVEYLIHRSFTTPDDIPELNTGDIETGTIFTRAMRRIQNRFYSKDQEYSDAIANKLEIDGTAINSAKLEGQSGSYYLNYNNFINKPDLSAFDDVLNYASSSNFPATGESGKLYIASDTGFLFRWSGSSYVQVTGAIPEWGVISGNISDQTDLQNILNDKSDNGHNHDDRYYTETESDNRFFKSASYNILNSTDDLNAITTTGHYGWTSSIPSNAPFTYGVLVVDNDGSKPHQFVYGSTNGQIALRRMNSGTWSQWVMSWTEQNFDPASKANVSHGHSWSEISSKPATATRWPSYSEITGTPSTFTPESHTHSINDVSDLQNQLGHARGQTEGSSSQDPNAATANVILTNHANGPRSGPYWHITTTFWSTISSTGNRSQFAIRYNGSPTEAYARHCYQNSWTPWVRCDNDGVTLTKSDVGLGSVDNYSRAHYDGRYLRSNTSNQYVDLSNNEQTSYDINGRLYWDLSAGLYIKSSNANWTGAALQWSHANVTAGTGISISYGTEDEPTISVSTAPDSSKLNGLTAGNYLRANATDYIYGQLRLRNDIVVESGYRDHGMFGTYDSTKTQHIWSMGNAYRTAADGSTLGDLYGLAYIHHNHPDGSGKGGSHQVVLCHNGVINCSLGNSVWTSGNVVAYSDIRVKTNLEVIPNALDKIQQFNGYTFDRTDVRYDETGSPTVPLRQTGVVAQELLEVLPEAVTGGPTENNPDGHYSVAYGNLVGLLVEGIKEEASERKKLEDRVRFLEEKLDKVLQKMENK